MRGPESWTLVLARVRSALGRPLVVASIVPIAVATAHAWWIWNHRTLGGFDPDEASYLSSALRMQRSIDIGSPFAFPVTVAGTGHGITVPMLSVPLLLLGPRDPRMAMMIQPILLVLIGVAAAGITLRLTGRRWVATVAAAVVVVMPTVTTATQSYWYGLGAAAAMITAMWALLASDGGANRNVWWFGAAVGAMLLSRTMTVGYLPACALAGLIVAWPERRRVLRVAGAVGLGVVIAAPWYIVNSGSIFGYLVQYGYGPRAELFGDADLGSRISLRWERLRLGLGWGTPAAAGLTIVAVGVVVVIVAAIVSPAWRPAAEPRRAWLALVAAVAAGMAALVSTANNGVWFELPLVVLCVPVLVAAFARLWRWVTVPVAALAIAGLAVNLTGALWFRDWGPELPVSHYEWGFSEYDERFAPSRRDDHPAAAAEWWALATDIEQTLRCISPDGRSAVFTVAGNTHLFNAGVVRMAAELDSWHNELWIPDTTASPARRAKELTPTVRMDRTRRSERVLVVGVHDQILWPADRDVDEFLAQARRSGFRETMRFTMPRGGHVLVLRHEDRSRGPSDGAVRQCRSRADDADSGG